MRARLLLTPFWAMALLNPKPAGASTDALFSLESHEAELHRKHEAISATLQPRETAWIRALPELTEVICDEGPVRREIIDRYLKFENNDWLAWLAK